MRVEQLVRELGIRLGLPLALDGNGMCRLVFNGGTTVDLEALRDDGEKFITMQFSENSVRVRGMRFIGRCCPPICLPGTVLARSSRSTLNATR